MWVFLVGHGMRLLDLHAPSVFGESRRQNLDESQGQLQNLLRRDGAYLRVLQRPGAVATSELLSLLAYDHINGRGSSQDVASASAAEAWLFRAFSFASLLQVCLRGVLLFEKGP